MHAKVRARSVVDSLQDTDGRGAGTRNRSDSTTQVDKRCMYTRMGVKEKRGGGQTIFKYAFAYTRVCVSPNKKG